MKTIIFDMDGLMFDTEKINELLNAMSLPNVSNINFAFKSKYVKNNDKWFSIPFDFQNDIKETDKMNVSAYINGDRTVIYFEAIGD